MAWFWARVEEEREDVEQHCSGAVPALALCASVSRARCMRISISSGTSACPGGKSTLCFTASSPAPCWAWPDIESALSNPPCFLPRLSGSVPARGRAGAGPRHRGCTQAGGAGPGAAVPGCPPLPALPGWCCSSGGPGIPAQRSSSSRGAPAAPSAAPGACGNEPS